jgi:squalene cyclase
MKWLNYLHYDPIEPLLSSKYDNVVYFTKRDLLEEEVGDIRELWDMKKAQRIIDRQKPDGRWEYPNPKERIRKKEYYDLLETYRQLGYLVEYFGCDKHHTAVQRAKEFVFKYQSQEGDIRGIYWNQYSPNYSAGFFELFIKAGYTKTKGILKGLEWLLSMRQDDGGWTIPVRTAKRKIKSWMDTGPPVQPDRSKRFSYLATGVVIRAFAYHPEYKKRTEIKDAAELVLSRLFQRDYYPDRSSAEYWTKFSFPFWFTDLIAILDPISHLEFKPEHPKVSEGLGWFIDQQKKDGTWNLKLLKGDKHEQPYWMMLNICRLFKRYYS